MKHVSMQSTIALDQSRNSCTHQTQNNGRREWDKYFSPKNFEPNVAGQTTKPESLQPRRQCVDQEQSQKDNDEPSKHSELSFHSTCVRSPWLNPIGSHSDVPSAMTLKSSPISCSVISFCAIVFSAIDASTKGVKNPQLIKKWAWLV